MYSLIARRYLYEGDVQGVGFRRTTEELASHFHVTGYVMNKADGRVEVHAEGPVEEIDLFADRIEKAFDRRITRVTQQLVVPEKFHHFSVTFEKRRVEL